MTNSTRTSKLSIFAWTSRYAFIWLGRISIQDRLFNFAEQEFLRRIFLLPKFSKIWLIWDGPDFVYSPFWVDLGKILLWGGQPSGKILLWARLGQNSPLRGQPSGKILLWVTPSLTFWSRFTCPFPVWRAQIYQNFLLLPNWLFIKFGSSQAGFNLIGSGRVGLIQISPDFSHFRYESSRLPLKIWLTHRSPILGFLDPLWPFLLMLDCHLITIQVNIFKTSFKIN